MSVARRPLLTATAAGTLLCALWFVPSANANQDTSARTDSSANTTTMTTTTTTTAQVTTQARVTSAGASEGDDDTRLADTGSFDTTPYVVGGTTLLAVGAGFVVYSVRRERLGF